MIEPCRRPLLLLWGFMGTGKSTLGRLVAAGAGVELVDLDARIVETSGLAIEQIFAQHGEAGFRLRERELLVTLLNEPRRHRVVALGGGALLDPSLRAQALDNAWLVSLRASLATLLARTREGGRPLLSIDGATGDAALEARLADLYNQRKDAYDSAHDTIDTDDVAPQALAAQILQRWHPPRRHPSSEGM